MRSGEISYQREPNHKQGPAEPIPPMGRGVCDEVWPGQRTRVRGAGRRGARGGARPGIDEYREALDYLLFHDYLERTRRSEIYKITDGGKRAVAEEGRS